jgi:hypothetical protein
VPFTVQSLEMDSSTFTPSPSLSGNTLIARSAKTHTSGLSGVLKLREQAQLIVTSYCRSAELLENPIVAKHDPVMDA